MSVDEDPINEHVIRAGLLDQGLKVLLEYGMRIYKEGFGQDLTDEKVMMMLYSKLGGLFGYMVYMTERKETMDMDAFIRQLSKLLGDSL